MSGKYLVFRDSVATGALSWTADRFFAQLVSARFVFDERDQAISDIGNRVGAPVQMTNTRVLGGWCNADSLVFRSVSGGPEAAGVIFYRSDGLLVEYHVAIEGFPIMLPADIISIEMSEPGIFRV